MEFRQEFIPIERTAMHDKAAELKEKGFRFVQCHAVKTDEAVDMYYTFMDMDDGTLYNYRIADLGPDDEVQSVSDLFLASFVFENEARELFGVNMSEIAIDFGGNMYQLAETEPMTFMSPEMKAEKDKAKKIALAKAAKARKAAAEKAKEQAAPEGEGAKGGEE